MDTLRCMRFSCYRSVHQVASPQALLLFLATGSLQKLYLLRVQCARACLIFPLILHPKHIFEGYLKGDAGDALLVRWGDA